MYATTASNQVTGKPSVQFWQSTLQQAGRLPTLLLPLRRTGKQRIGRARSSSPDEKDRSVPRQLLFEAGATRAQYAHELHPPEGSSLLRLRASE
jgi:hypothetical protein